MPVFIFSNLLPEFPYKSFTMTVILKITQPQVLSYSHRQRARSPRQDVDHGTMGFQRRPGLNMVGHGLTVMCDHGVLSALDHGILPTIIVTK